MGQVVPFPNQRARAADGPETLRDRPTADHAIPVVSPARLYLAGLVAQCPALHGVIYPLRDHTGPDRLRREWILYALLQQAPRLPEVGDCPGLPTIHELPFAEVEKLAQRQLERSERDRRLLGRWSRTWRVITDPQLKEFAQRIAVALTELYHLAA